MKTILNAMIIALLAMTTCAWAQDDKEAKEEEQKPPTQYDLNQTPVDTSVEITEDQLQEMVKTNAEGMVTHRYTVYEDAQGRLVKHGSYKEWYDSGQLARELTYAHDKPDGRQVWYHTNGKVWMEFTTKMGVRDGTYIENWRNGKRKTLIIYRDGKVIRRQ